MLTTGAFLVFLLPACLVAESSCPPEVGKTWTPAKLLSNLTDKSVYDKSRTPQGFPVNVLARTHIYHIKASSHNSKFSIQILLQLRWKDERLNYARRNTGITQIIGEKLVMKSIWIPHLLLPNEKGSPVTGYLRKDDLITILPHGEVLYATRLKTSLACESNLRKFPFDKQTCFLPIKTWTAAEVALDWETRDARLQHREITLSEFYLINITADKFTDNSTYEDVTEPNDSLLLTVRLGRQYGFYIMDFYLPSILVVILSWMTFWLSADQVPPRVLLGSSTMLTCMLLAWFDSSTPKLSRLSANKIWAFGCLAFTFMSLVEFAFVNTIDRRDREHRVELKKPTSKYILRSSLSTAKTPTRPRQRRSSSCPSSPELRRLFRATPTSAAAASTYRTLHEASGRDLARGVRAALKDLRRGEEGERGGGRRLSQLPNPFSSDPGRRDVHVHVMTHQEIAMWIDQRSRIAFPLGFLFFNIFYWIYVLSDLL